MCRKGLSHGTGCQLCACLGGGSAIVPRRWECENVPDEPTESRVDKAVTCRLSVWGHKVLSERQGKGCKGNLLLSPSYLPMPLGPRGNSHKPMGMAGSLSGVFPVAVGRTPPSPPTPPHLCRSSASPSCCACLTRAFLGEGMCHPKEGLPSTPSPLLLLPPPAPQINREVLTAARFGQEDF